MISYFGIGACSVFHCLFLSLVVVHLGNCFYTRRIERLGNAPILSSGFEQRRVLVNESTNSERQQSKAHVQKSPSTSSSNKLRDDEIVPIIRGMQVIQMNLSKAENRLRKQMNFPSFQKVALNVYNDFPMKFYKWVHLLFTVKNHYLIVFIWFRGLTKFYLSTNKISRRVSSHWSRFWSKDGSSTLWVAWAGCDLLYDHSNFWQLRRNVVISTPRILYRLTNFCKIITSNSSLFQ